MALVEYLSEEDMLEVEPQDKWRLLDYLLNFLFERGKLTEENYDEIRDSIIEREKSMSTGIGDGVALPHCSSTSIDEPLMLMAVCRKGMDFEAIDQNPVQFIIFLVVPKNKFQTHITTLAEIAKVMNDTSFRQGLLECSNTREMYHYIQKKAVA